MLSALVSAQGLFNAVVIRVQVIFSAVVSARVMLSFHSCNDRNAWTIWLLWHNMHLLLDICINLSLFIVVREDKIILNLLGNFRGIYSNCKVLQITRIIKLQYVYQNHMR